MLVANGVVGDSRVQKVARSMAGLGWDAVLVGRAPGAVREEFALGGARVVLVPVRASGSSARWLLRTGVAGGRVLLGRYGGRSGVNPWLRDLEGAMAPEVAGLRPELIHAHDGHMVGIASRLAARMAAAAAAEPDGSAAGRPVRWVYDAHEYLAGVESPGGRDLRARFRRRMLIGEERAHIRRADAVVTVSPTIAELLRADHRLPAAPEIVLNAPLGGASCGAGAAAGAGGRLPDVRHAAGLPSSTPVLLYSGGMAPKRGVPTLIDALRELPGVHLVLVARQGDSDVPGLLERAAWAGVAERVRVVPYVTPEQVVEYIASATIGVVPLLHRRNHELSLITKYFEYAAARLPILCSDVREMAATTRRLGVGEVFRAGDAGSLAAAVRPMLADPGRYRAAYLSGEAAELAGGGWERQALVLDGLYRRLTTPDPGGPARCPGD
jgi:glycosyltransferase involved in cell wall biosynthesis